MDMCIERVILSGQYAPLLYREICTACPIDTVAVFLHPVANAEKDIHIPLIPFAVTHRSYIHQDVPSFGNSRLNEPHEMLDTLPFCIRGTVSVRLIGGGDALPQTLLWEKESRSVTGIHIVTHVHLTESYQSSINNNLLFWVRFAYGLEDSDILI